MNPQPESMVSLRTSEFSPLVEAQIFLKKRCHHSAFLVSLWHRLHQTDLKLTWLSIFALALYLELEIPFLPAHAADNPAFQDTGTVIRTSHYHVACPNDKGILRLPIPPNRGLEFKIYSQFPFHFPFSLPFDSPFLRGILDPKP